VRRRLAYGLAAVSLAGIATGTVWGDFHRPVAWSPDGLFYQERLLEIRGKPHDQAVKEVFFGPISATLRRFDPARLTDPRWISYNEAFFKRRLTVPATGAAIYPLDGKRSLLDVSLVGYVVAIVALFAFLVVRFSPVAAASATLATILLPQLKGFAGLPLTDSWGLALEILAFAFAVLTLDRGPRWLWGWIAVLLVLSFTRDNGWIAVAAIAWLAWRTRTRNGVLLLGTGFAALLPALFAYPLSYRRDLAFTVNNAEPPQHATWHFIASHYPHAVSHLVRSDVGFLRNGQWYTAAYFAVGIVSLFIGRRTHGRDNVQMLVRSGAVAALLYLLVLPNFSAFRLELAFVPMAAFGIGLVVERIARTALREWIHVGTRLEALLIGGGAAKDGQAGDTA
jgi:hypothetical protein